MDMSLELPGFRVNETRYMGRRSCICSGIRRRDGTPVTIKTHLSNSINETDRRRYRLEFEVGSHFQHTHVLRYLELVETDTRVAIIQEDFEGVKLSETIPEAGFELPHFLNLACQLARALESIHSQNLVHKKINPSSILFCHREFVLKVVDFSVASQLHRETQLAIDPHRMQGVLAYISPEQTGRMNRQIDYRSDLYSLGVTLYEMLVGHPPFQKESPMELVHCHMAREPIPPHERRSSIPIPVSKILVKLLAKNAENRYQSARGVLSDLRHCFDEIQQSRAIQHFEIAQHDFTGRLSIPQKLFGRELESASIMESVTRATKGRPELQLVSGESGLGKSALVFEIKMAIAARPQHFAYGKYDQNQHNTPYSAIVSALQTLVRELLAESDERLKHWREAFLAALGRNGRILTEVVADLEKIIGPQPAVPKIGLIESRNRFNLVFLEFIRALSRSEQPLIMFLDDLQWADSASFKLMHMVLTDTEMKHLSLIGAFRSDEVEPNSPLRNFINQMKEESVPMKVVALHPLTLQDIVSLISESLQWASKDAHPLAVVVKQTTNGNPLLVKQFLNNLHVEGVLTFNFESCSWQCDMENVVSLGVTDNVLDILIPQLTKLPVTSLESLRVAACLGSSFNLQILSLACETQAEKLIETVTPALDAGLLLPMLARDDQGLIERYQFLHDRVRQAAYSLIPESGRNAFHYRIGQLLLKGMSDEKLEQRLFVVLHHLNFGCETIETREERFILARLNYRAGDKAKAAVAYVEALQYFKTASQLVGGQGWTDNYRLTFDIQRATIEAEYLATQFNDAEQRVQKALPHAKDIVDRARLTQLLLLLLTQRLNYEQALEIGFSTLRQLDIEIVDTPPHGLSTEAVLALPRMTSRSCQVGMDIMVTLMGPAYIADYDALQRLVFSMLHLSLRQGNSAGSVYAYSMYGALNIATAKVEEAYRLGSLALRLSGTLNAPEMKCRALNMFNSCIRHWKEPLPICSPDGAEGVRVGLEYGDVENASYCAIHHANNSLFAGVHLDSTMSITRDYLDLMKRLKQSYAVSHLRITLHFVSHLVHGRQTMKEFDEANLDREFLDELVEAKSYTVLFWFYTARSILDYMHGRIPEAIANAEAASPLAINASGLVSVGQHNFFYSLALLARYGKESSETKEKFLSIVRSNQEQMGQWVVSCPDTFQHKHDLVEAELSRCLCRTTEAIDLYERAIRGAGDNSYPQDEALANELTAKFWLEQGRFAFAEVHLRQAQRLSEQWGAKSKATQLVEEYKEMFSSSLLPANGDRDAMAVSRNEAVNPVEVPPAEPLDLTAVIEAALAISGTIDLGELLTRIMRIVVENAGAQKGALILEKAGSWVIEAQSELDGRVSVLESIPVESGDGIPKSIVNYVKRTGERLVLTNPAENAAHQSDPYLAENQPKSILCTPVIVRHDTAAILYLENRLTADAFTPDRQMILNVLTAQAAISLQIARSYEALRESEEKHKILLENLPQKIFFKDRNSAYVSCNVNFARDFGVEVNEISGKNDYDFFPKKMAEKYCADDKRIMDSGLSEELEETYEIDGQKTTVQTVKTPVRNEKGQVVGILGVFWDITEKINIEEQLRQSQKMEAIGQLAGGIAHDFNNQLSVILGYADMLVDTLKDDRTLHYFEHIIRSAEQAANLTAQLLAFSRKGKNLSEPVDIDKVLGEVTSILEHSIDKRINIRRWTREDSAVTIGDPSQLQNAILNIAINARDAMPKGGELAFARNCCELDEEFCKKQPYAIAPGPYVRISVTDTGCGMDEETQNHIFEPFFTTKAVGEGTGMGLASVYGTVRNHKGTITVQSESGQGTTFRLYLPLAEGVVIREAPARARSVVTGTAQILLVDDEEMLRELGAEMLRKLGYRVALCRDGREAVEYYKNSWKEIDLVILDMVMPRLGGRDAFAAMRKINPQIRAILSSGYSINGRAQSIIDDGVMSFLGKPFKQADLSKIVAQVLNSKRSGK